MTTGAENLITINGTKRWYQNGKLHRTDGPAIEWANGDKEWWQNNQLHRTDGPAVECANGTTYWYQNDQFHRTDGPAIERADGIKYWYINGDEIIGEQLEVFKFKIWTETGRNYF